VESWVGRLEERSRVVLGDLRIPDFGDWKKCGLRARRLTLNDIMGRTIQ
jgi:hypothetical protein